MPEDRTLLDRLQSQTDHLPDYSSGLVELGHALAGQLDTDKEKGCVAYQEALPDYIEAELNGQPVRRLYPDLARHLDLCPDCGEMYVDLLEIALQAETEPLPLSSVAPSSVAPSSVAAPDFSFLSPLTVAAQMRQVVEAVTTDILARWFPEVLADLSASSQTFFRQLCELGADFQLRRGPELALAFGPDLPPALQSLVATHTATAQVIRSLPVEELQAELSGACPPRTLNKQARAAARTVGLSRGEANRWADEYVTSAQANAADFLALARRTDEADR